MSGEIDRIESALRRADAKVGFGDRQFHYAMQLALSEITAIRQQSADIAERDARIDYLELQISGLRDAARSAEGELARLRGQAPAGFQARLKGAAGWTGPLVSWRDPDSFERTDCEVRHLYAEPMPATKENT